MKNTTQGPTIIAVQHTYHNQQDNEKVQRIIQTTSKKGTIFVELMEKFYNEMLAIYSPERDPIIFAAHVAQTQGRRVVFLDRNWLRLLPKIHRGIFKENVTKLDRYILHNIREKDRTRKLQQYHASPNDIIIMHPDHVRGFLLESKLPNPKVIWLSPPQKGEWKRLTTREKRSVRRERIRGAKRRVEKRNQRPRRTQQ